MKPIIKQTEQDVILTSKITNKHIVVAFWRGTPVYLFEDAEGYLLVDMSDFRRGGSYDFTDNKTKQKVVEYLIKDKAPVEVFKPNEWHKALQWLIDNGKQK